MDTGALRAYLETLASLPAPKSILCVSAHWEAPVPTVMTAPSPPMLYDYYGFPPQAYEFVWPAPGAPGLATRVQELLSAAGFEPAADPDRGFDHGTFVPLMVPFPDPKIPVTQLSLVAGLDPALHLAIGRALAPLRDEGVLIVGSGMSYHNLPAFMAAFRDPRVRQQLVKDAGAFDNWLGETLALEPGARADRLARWEHAPAARASHPREEHLIPLMVVAGAAGDAPARTPFRDAVLGATVRAVHFG